MVGKIPGMTNQELATGLVNLCKEGKFYEATETYYADNCVSVEAMSFNGMPRETVGKPAILGKSAWWAGAHEVHSMAVEGPFISPEYFAVKFDLDVTVKSTGQRMRMSEVGLYTVVDGKIVRDEFLYAG